MTFWRPLSYCANNLLSISRVIDIHRLRNYCCIDYDDWNKEKKIHLRKLYFVIIGNLFKLKFFPEILEKKSLLFTSE